MRSLIRLHQLLLILVILGGCYAPELRDCTVTCSGPGSCASGQVCGADGFCAAPELAGTCRAGVDAGLEAPVRVSLRIQIAGTGKVEVLGAGSCTNAGPPDCSISVPRGQVVITATPNDKPFERWTTPNCAGQGASCTFNADAATTVGVKFK